MAAAEAGQVEGRKRAGGGEGGRAPGAHLGRSHAGPTTACRRAQELKGASYQAGGEQQAQQGSGTGDTQVRDTQGEEDGDKKGEGAGGPEGREGRVGQQAKQA
jgi:hypothetical protein